MSQNGGEKGEVEFWIGQQEGDSDLFAVSQCGDGIYTEVRDVTRKDIVSLRDILNEILDSDLR